MFLIVFCGHNYTLVVVKAVFLVLFGAYTDDLRTFSAI